jgi:hypothetical protein
MMRRAMPRETLPTDPTVPARCRDSDPNRNVIQSHL